LKEESRQSFLKEFPELLFVVEISFVL